MTSTSSPKSLPITIQLKSGHLALRGKNGSLLVSKTSNDLSTRSEGFRNTGEERDIFERLYAVRLDRLRQLEECRSVLKSLDHQGVLGADTESSNLAVEEIDEEELLSELSEVDVETANITELQHVRSSSEKRQAEEVASRQQCADFDRFKPLFEKVQRELSDGMRETRPFELKADIEVGRFFIVGGQKAFVAEKGDVFTNEQGRTDARLRVIFDNGTESNMLMRSLQRSLNKDEAGKAHNRI